MPNLARNLFKQINTKAGASTLVDGSQKDLAGNKTGRFKLNFSIKVTRVYHLNYKFYLWHVSKNVA